jgi:hypothetical protein
MKLILMIACEMNESTVLGQSRSRSLDVDFFCTARLLRPLVRF